MACADASSGRHRRVDLARGQERSAVSRCGWRARPHRLGRQQHRQCRCRRSQTPRLLPRWYLARPDRFRNGCICCLGVERRARARSYAGACRSDGGDRSHRINRSDGSDRGGCHWPHRSDWPDRISPGSACPSSAATVHPTVRDPAVPHGVLRGQHGRARAAKRGGLRRKVDAR
jgi:hypothetical protein